MLLNRRRIRVIIAKSPAQKRDAGRKGNPMNTKTRSLIRILLIYLIAYAAGFFVSMRVRDTVLRWFLFDLAATAVTFLFSVLHKNSSVYDAYWSLTPAVILILLLPGNGPFSAGQVCFLVLFLLWSLRLTLNWISVFTGFDYEDWRYRKFRSETPKPFWPVVNLCGIHLMPTLIVFLNMLPVFEIVQRPIGPGSVPGLLLLAAGITLETCADRAMHAFLSGPGRGNVCTVGLWRYSRHPNYLGEITVWLGVYLTMLPSCPEKAFLAVGPAAMYLMFRIISIPLMEKRQLSRREAYRNYRETTSCLLIIPKKVLRD